ncbi:MULTISPECIES: hypothetical protein [unclassified Rathayibacter]|uniref:hypothetical protein n=1 Tax=unclassified Rathayibacter TaxID=2609250 RepID=UPI000CE81AC3|nr:MULTISPECIES: hypothetical protein [unclassified Rathayibacter]PPG50439.1 hypothetical protein C5C24_09960 [Rathayibacter sp. AY2B3]PPI20517.1 hypothetical protein C5D08_10895 [Rathayibacter sp. AY1B6]PPI24098.1 hypothetical protein C5D44_12410 [Rathayibacter sp. AY1B5]PPI35248.1 hypothetical protein C5D34_07190 [Rathayibacter sp. AY1B1]
MSSRRNRTTASRTLTPWTALAFALVGALAGAGVSTAVGAKDPWSAVITAVIVAVVLLAGWALQNVRSRRH